VRLQAVDSVRREPLAGVETTWRQDKAALPFGVYHAGPTNLPPSGSDGIIELAGVRESWRSSLVFSKAGYATVYGSYGDSELTLAPATNAVATYGPFIIKGPFSVVRPTNGFFIVTMKSL
jgi:hypothetical protein